MRQRKVFVLLSEAGSVYLATTRDDTLNNLEKLTSINSTVSMLASIEQGLKKYLFSKVKSLLFKY